MCFLWYSYQLVPDCNVGDPNFMDAAKDAADKAVTCGVEINLECSNYPILLKDGSGDSSKVRMCGVLPSFTCCLTLGICLNVTNLV